MIAPNWDQPKCPIRSKWINKYVEYYYYNKKKQSNAKDNNLDESQTTQMVKNSPAMQETRFDPWVGEIPWRRKWLPSPVCLLGKTPWTEDPGGLYSPWGCKE